MSVPHRAGPMERGEKQEREMAHGGAGMGRRESGREDIIGCPVSNVANQENCRATDPGRELGLLGGRWDLWFEGETRPGHWNH